MRERQAKLATAREYLSAALELLDVCDAPGQIGANVDLALHQLDAELGAGDGDGSASALVNDANLAASWSS